MTLFIFFALYLCMGVCMLVVWPILLHPTMPAKRKIILSLLAFFVLVPGGLLLYGVLGTPELAG